METKKKTFVKVPIVDLQKKYEGRAFNMKIDNNGNEPVRVRLFGDGSVFVQAVGGKGGDTPTPGPGGQGLTPEERAAIVNLFRMATYTGDNAEGYIEILESHATLTGIDAVFTQGAAVIYPTTSLDDLKQYLVVTAQYDDGTTMNVTDYTLSGTLTAGISTITATYQGFSDTFTVNVTAQPVMTGINAVFTQGAAVIYTTASLDSLRQYLTVDANFSDGSSIRVNAYTLSGTLAAGTSTITAAYEGFTDDFTVVVTAAPTVTSIDAVYTQGNVIVYDGDILDKLKCSLVVTANYSDGTTQVVDDYSLSGTLATGISTITVTSEGLTDTFSVEVSALHAMYSVDGSEFEYCVPTQDPPYYQYREDRYRWSYVKFDLLLTGNKTYRFAMTFKNRVNETVRLGVQAFSQVVLNAVANNNSWVWSQDQWDSGWKILGQGSLDPSTLYVDVAIPENAFDMSPIEGVRFTVSYQYESDFIREGLSIENISVIDISNPTLVGIDASYSPGNMIVYDGDDLDKLRSALTVKEVYSDGTQVAVNDYTLSGTLSAGASQITVTHDGFTDTFLVNVNASHALYSRLGNDFIYQCPTQDPPYHALVQDRYRWSYVDFDLLLEGGYTYEFALTFRNAESDLSVYMGVQAYSQKVLDAVAQNQSWDWQQDQHDTGWLELGTGGSSLSTNWVSALVPEYISGHEQDSDYKIKGVRVTLRYPTDSTLIEDGLDIVSLNVIKLD